MTSPFGLEPVEEVPLGNAPLARVLAQVRFPRLASLSVSDDVANRIALALDTNYPLLQEGRDMVVTITPEGVSQQPGNGRTWHLRDAAEEWQVTFGPEFVALHTSAYKTRADFLARFNTVISAFETVAKPTRSERIGFRYINRLEGEDVTQVADLVSPAILGGLAVPTLEHDVTVVHTLSEALYTMPAISTVSTDALHARWGQLPAGAVIDPTLDAINAPTWILDVDSSRTGSGTFGTEAIHSAVVELADRAYRFFRWSVTEEFLRRFGAPR